MILCGEGVAWRGEAGPGEVWSGKARRGEVWKPLW